MKDILFGIFHIRFMHIYIIIIILLWLYFLYIINI